MQTHKVPAACLFYRWYAALLFKGDLLMEDKITMVIDYLNEVRTRCTYNAADKALGITPHALAAAL